LYFYFNGYRQLWLDVSFNSIWKIIRKFTYYFKNMHVIYIYIYIYITYFFKKNVNFTYFWQGWLKLQRQPDCWYKLSKIQQDPWRF
ncbi:hypothetical protein ACMBCM_05970, partial [Spiroplasma sp. K1]